MASLSSKLTSDEPTQLPKEAIPLRTRFPGECGPPIIRLDRAALGISIVFRCGDGISLLCSPPFSVPVFCAPTTHTLHILFAFPLRLSTVLPLYFSSSFWTETSRLLSVYNRCLYRWHIWRIFG